MYLTGDFTMHAADTSAQRAHSLAHPLELLGVRIPPDLRSLERGHPVVVLAQPQAVFLGRLDQMLAASLQQPAVGGICQSLGHDGGVHDDLLRAGLAGHAATPGSLDASQTHRILGTEFNRLMLGSIYRALNDLWAAGLLIRTEGAPGRAFYAIKPKALRAANTTLSSSSAWPAFDDAWVETRTRKSARHCSRRSSRYCRHLCPRPRVAVHG